MEITNRPVIIPSEELKELKKENEDYEEKLSIYNQVLEHVEIFLTYWYEQTEDFGKIRDDFNEIDEFPCKLRLKNDRIKLKLDLGDEENSSSN